MPSWPANGALICFCAITAWVRTIQALASSSSAAFWSSVALVAKLCVRQRLGPRQVGLGQPLLRLVVGEVGALGLVVDLDQGVAGLHDRAGLEADPDHAARHLRRHVDLAHRDDGADAAQVLPQRPDLDRHGRDRRRRRDVVGEEVGDPVPPRVVEPPQPEAEHADQDHDDQQADDVAGAAPAPGSALRALAGVLVEGGGHGGPVWGWHRWLYVRQAAAGLAASGPVRAAITSSLKPMPRRMKRVASSTSSRTPTA